MNSKLNPYYIVGLVDGEGCFCVSFNKHKDNRKLEVRLLFEIELREDDKESQNFEKYKSGQKWSFFGFQKIK